jgi:hypothetical protein
MRDVFKKNFQMLSWIENKEGFFVISTINDVCGNANFESKVIFETCIFEGAEEAENTNKIKDLSARLKTDRSESLLEAIETHLLWEKMLNTNKLKLNKSKIVSELLSAISGLYYIADEMDCEDYNLDKLKIEIEKVNKIIKEVEE